MRRVKARGVSSAGVDLWAGLWGRDFDFEAFEVVEKEALATGRACARELGGRS